MTGIDRNGSLPEEVWESIRQVLTERLGYQLESLQARPEEDYSGEVVIAIDAYHPLLDREVDPRVTYKLPGILREALLEQGESRYPLIRHHFQQDQEVASP